MEWKRSNSSYSVNVSLLFTMWTSTRKAVTDLKGREAFSEHFQSSRHATSPRGWNAGHFSKMIFHSWFIPGFILHFQMFATLEFNFNKFIFHTFVCLYFEFGQRFELRLIQDLGIFYLAKICKKNSMISRSRIYCNFVF